MRVLRRNNGSRTAIPLIVPLSLLVAIGTLTPVVAARAAASKSPACRVAQIKVTVGATETKTSLLVRTSTGHFRQPTFEEVPLYFYNRGVVCHLQSYAPFVTAVRNVTRITKSSVLPSRDVAHTTPAWVTGRHLIVDHDQSIRAFFIVVKPVGKSLKNCNPATTTGFTIQGWAKPTGTERFIARRLRDVCFWTGKGVGVFNFGIVWHAT